MYQNFARMNYFKFLLLFAVCFIGCSSSNQNEEKEVEATEIVRSDEFRKIDPREIPGNPIELIGEEWMLLTAGNKESYNTMTVGWGTLGDIWGNPVITCYVRPDRYTFNFIEKSEYYTLCFFDRNYRSKLRYCGATSGRDLKGKNKAEEAGLTPMYTENGSIYFKEAYLVLECKKLYSDQFKAENFAAEVVMIGKEGAGGPAQSVYNEMSEYHKFYIGGIVNCWMR